MNDLVINGRVCQIEQDDHDELTIFGRESIEFVLPLIETGEEFPVSKPNYCAVDVFGEVLGHGTNAGIPFIRVECFTLYNGKIRNK